MGICVSFQDKNTHSEFTSISYGTMNAILTMSGLGKLEGYYVHVPAKRAVRAFEKVLADAKGTLWEDTTCIRFIRQMVADYNTYRKQGNKPRWFCGG